MKDRPIIGLSFIICYHSHRFLKYPFIRPSLMYSVSFVVITFKLLIKGNIIYMYCNYKEEKFYFTLTARA